MNWFNRHESVRLEYTNQFNHFTKHIWVDSIKSKEWFKWFKTISRLNARLTFLGKRFISLTFSIENVPFRWHFWDILNQFNSFNHTNPSKSIDSVTYLKKTNCLSHQSTYLENKLNQFNQFCGKTRIDSNQSTQSSWLIYKSAMTKSKNECHHRVLHSKLLIK